MRLDAGSVSPTESLPMVGLEYAASGGDGVADGGFGERFEGRDVGIGV